ncbi:MAG: hypothetical protein ACE5KS_05375, partial [Woeseiaceae bacterium]
DVAAAIIDAMRIHVGANPTRGRPTENTAAYALFLKARALVNSYPFRDAEAILVKAIELDPKFAEAYELLAYCYWQMSGGVLTAAEAQKLTGEAAAKALAIEPDLVFAQALYQSGNVESYSRLGEIEAFERIVREQPDNPAILNALFWDLLVAGYLQEAAGVAERYVELDPLSLDANYSLVNALYASGHTSEAVAALDVLDQLDPNGANSVIGVVNVVEKRDEIAISRWEAVAQQQDYDSSWVRELVTGARDPATGQAYLDRRIPQIVASVPEEEAIEMQRDFKSWYLFFGFLDRYFEIILDFDPTDSRWTDADYLVYNGTVYRRLGFTAHPKYLEVAESMGIINIWEQRGPPDFCEKVGGQWVCE